MLSVLHNMEYACPCRICGEHEHLTGKCPELIYATPGGGGGGGHDHDDDEGSGPRPDDGARCSALHPTACLWGPGPTVIARVVQRVATDVVELMTEDAVVD